MLVFRLGIGWLFFFFFSPPPFSSVIFLGPQPGVFFEKGEGGGVGICYLVFVVVFRRLYSLSLCMLHVSDVGFVCMEIARAPFPFPFLSFFLFFSTLIQGELRRGGDGWLAGIGSRVCR